ncbi:arginase family protein, partial [Microcella sp.]|uniref:arginase family protein n=1 Tax=Microcella sp. TaxID=1913979 RepID=UPI00299F7E9B
MTVLAHDPLWPRAGDWSAWAPGMQADAVVVGIPTWRTALSPGQAHTTPAAIRDALRYYSADALTRPDGSPLTVLDAGDVPEPDAGDVPEPDGVGEAAATARVAELAGTGPLVIVLGGDNAATVPAALGSWGAAISTAGLVTLDAHHDLRDGVTNGSPVR